MPDVVGSEQLGVRNDGVTRVMLASIAYFLYDLWAMFHVFTLKSRDHYGKKQCHQSMDKGAMCKSEWGFYFKSK